MVRALDRHISSEESRIAFDTTVIRCGCGRAIQSKESRCVKCQEAVAEIMEFAEWETEGNI